MSKSKIIEHASTCNSKNEKIVSRHIDTLSTKKKKEIFDLFRAYSAQMSPEIFDITGIAKKYKITPNSLESFIEEKSNITYNKDLVSNEERPKNTEDGERPISVVHVEGPKPMSEEEMIELYKIDTKIYEVAKIKHNQRPTSMHRQDGRIAQIMNHQTTLELSRKHPQFFDKLKPYIENMLTKEIKVLQQITDIKDRKNHEPIEENRIKSGNLGITIYADTHFNIAGKQSLNTRKKKILAADMKCLEKMDRIGSINKQLFVILGDFFTSDNMGNNPRTGGGVPQQLKESQMNGRKKGADLVTETIYNKSLLTPLDVIVTPGNHDPNKLFFLRELLEERFKNNERIRFIMEDTVNPLLTFYDRGNTYLGFAHRGNKNELSSYMNRNGSKNKERYLGDKHNQEVINERGIRINTLGAMKQEGGRYIENGVDRHNGNTYGALFNKKDGRTLELYEKI